jgi:hypothetical protein
LAKGGAPLSELPREQPARRRRPTLRAALEAARKAGLSVKSAAVENERVMLTFVGDDAPIEAGSNEWDKALGRGKH